MTKSEVTKEWLENKYLIESKTTREIAALLDCKIVEMYYLFKKHGISFSRHANRKIIFDKEEFVKLYSQDMLTLDEIKEVFNCSRSTVKRNIKYYQLSRDTSERSKEKLIGKKFGNLTVICRVKKGNSSGTDKWLCKCECGEEVLRSEGPLLKDKTRSCGCKTLKIENSKLVDEYPKFKNTLKFYFTYISRAKYGAKQRDLLFNISHEYLLNLFNFQDGKCALSGMDIFFEEKISTASLDRIDSSKGYIEGNVQWVHKDINYMKLAMSQEGFIKMCNLVSDFSKDKEGNSPNNHNNQNCIKEISPE